NDGINGIWDYGPLGVELKRNIKDAWWQDMVRNPPPGPDGQEIRMVGLDCAIIMNPKVWVASGHVGGFSDPMVDCKETKNRYRADHLFCGEIVAVQQGQQRSFGWMAVLEGDDVLSVWIKRAEKLLKKKGG